MKIPLYDFIEKSLEEIPFINEQEDFELKLDNNLISALENIPSNCVRLSLSQNKISFISKRLLNNNNVLSLDISFNRLISLSGIDRLSKLRELNLSNNYIADDQLLFLQNLIQVRTLNLSNNNLKTALICSVIGSLTNLEKLNISNNNFELLEFGSPCDNLASIELDSNKIRLIAFKCKFRKLNFLSVANNKLELIANPHNVENLEVFIGSNNSVLKPDFIDQFRSIRIINLRNNLINKYKYEGSNNNKTDEHIFTNHSQHSQHSQQHALDKINDSFLLNMSSCNFSNLEILEFSYNNITEFSLDLEGERPKQNSYFNSLKTVLLDNNRISDLNFYQPLISLEYMDLNNNDLISINFLKFCPNLICLDLSFNKFENVYDLLHIIKSMKIIRELNLVENEFNKGFYNLDLIQRNNNQNDEENMNTVQYINDYIKNADVNRIKDLLDYRAYVIVKLPTVDKLDTIFISESERTNVLPGVIKNPHLNIRIKDKDKGRNVEEIISRINSYPEFENKNMIEKLKESNYYHTISNLDNKSSANNINIPQQKSYENEAAKIVNVNICTNANSNTFTGCNNNMEKPLKSFTMLNKQNNNANNKNNKQSANNSTTHPHVYHILKKTFTRICDKNGYIKFSDIKNLTEDIAKFYDIKSETNLLVNEIFSEDKSASIFPGTIHFREFTGIIKNQKYRKMFDLIEKKLLEENSNVSFNKNVKIDKNVNANFHHKKSQKQTQIQFNKLELLTSVDRDGDVQFEFDDNNNNINNINNHSQFERLNNSSSKLEGKINPYNNYYKRNYNTKSFRTPLLNTLNKNTEKLKKSEKLEKSENQIPNYEQNSPSHIDNILLQSQNHQIDYKVDLNDKKFIIKFLLFISTPPIPIKHSDYSTKFFYNINSNQREFSFILNLLTHFNIEQFSLKKFYSQQYYDLIFKDFSSFEFVFENNFYLFYGEVNRQLESFIKMKIKMPTQDSDYNLIVEESPIKLLNKLNCKGKGNLYSSLNSFVIYVMIQKSSGEGEERISYDVEEDNFIFFDPFNILGYGKNAKSLILPIYIINIS